VEVGGFESERIGRWFGFGLVVLFLLHSLVVRFSLEVLFK
jgi:hypothetical protein